MSEDRSWLLTALGKPAEDRRFYEKDEATGKDTDVVTQRFWKWRCGCTAFSHGADNEVWHWMHHCREHTGMRQP